jgi:hypothetical protein
MAARRLPRRAHPPIKKIAWAAQPVCNLPRRVVVGKIARIGERFIRMPSGAGHDAMVCARRMGGRYAAHEAHHAAPASRSRYAFDSHLIAIALNFQGSRGIGRDREWAVLVASACARALPDRDRAGGIAAERQRCCRILQTDVRCRSIAAEHGRPMPER